jgi:preprotein translocase subunit YajC
VCAAPLPGRQQACKIAIEIAGRGGQIGGIVEAGQRCNWAIGRYSPRRFRWPKPGRRRGRARADSTRDAEMLVTPAFAQMSSPFGGDSLWVQLLPFVLIFVIMYFLILRPQQKRAKEHQELIKNLRRGDTVITSGGLVGKVTKVVDDDQIEVEIADGVRVRQVRAMVSGVRAKGEPVKDDGS